MANVITYGTFDLFHIGHLRILERARELAGPDGTLTVVVSSDKFNWEQKGKKCAIPDHQRAAIVASLKCVDKVIFENTWEQKRQDVIDNKIDIFVMGDDWKGKFDFLCDLCKVVYLPRTPDISSTEIKAQVKATKTTRDCQLVQLKLLHVFDEFCKKHDIPYFLSGGTLLGAMRHDGFIPWDDDLDVGMSRKDYKRFIDQVQKEGLPSDVYLKTPENAPESMITFAKLVDRHSIFLESTGVVACSRPNGIFIDIFMYDEIPNLGVKAERMLVKVCGKSMIYMRALRSAGRRGWLGSLFGGWAALLFALVNRSVWLLIKTLLLIRPAKRLYLNANFGFFVVGIRKDAFYPLTTHRFEDADFPIPKDADACLTDQYRDWRKLPPEDKRHGTHGAIIIPNCL